jgi:holin-like protein
MGGRTLIEALAALLVFQLAGEFLVAWSGLPVPGPVLGMVFLLAFLAAMRRVPGDIGPVAQTLLRHLSLLFVPAAVGVIVHVERIEDEWLPILAALILSTILTIAVTAAVFRLVVRATGGEGEADEEMVP